MPRDATKRRRGRRRAPSNRVHLYKSSEGTQVGVVHIRSGPDIFLSSSTVAKLEGKCNNGKVRSRQGNPGIQADRGLPKLITNGAGMCGWMHRKGDLALSRKLGQHEVSRHLKWTAYYFVADCTAKMLLQFKSKGDQSARDLILLDGAKVLAVGAVRLFTTVHAFKISQRSGRVVYLACEDKEACQRWMRLLRSIVYGKPFDKGSKQREQAEDVNTGRLPVRRTERTLKEMTLFDGTLLTDELKQSGMAVLPRAKLGVRSDDERVETEPWLLVSCEHAAAMQIQGQYRMWVARRRLRLCRSRKDAAVRLQAFMRRLLAQSKCEGLLAEIKAAITVQSCWRMHQDFVEYRTRLKQLQGATALQKTWLMYRVRALYIRTRKAYLSAVSEFVTEMVEKSTGRAVLLLLDDIQYAITQIQAKQRMIVTRGEYIEIQRKVKAIKLQRFFRRTNDRRKAQLWRKQMLRMNAAADSIAMAWRRRMLSVRIKHRLQRKAACIDIQRNFRGRLARSRANLMRQDLNKRVESLRSRIAAEFLDDVCKALLDRCCAARIVQRRIRSYFVRCEFVAARQHQHDLTRCAQRIQGIARGHLFRKELSYLRENAVRIQSVARRFLARKVLATLRIERRHALAQRIQRWHKSIIGWRLAMIQQEQESYLFGSAGLILKQTVIVNGRLWGVRSRLLDTCATIHISIIDLRNSQCRDSATFSGWSVVRVLQTHAHRCFTLKQLVSLLCRSLVLNEVDKASERITPDPFKRFLRTQTAHSVTMASITKALESTARIQLRSPQATEYDEQVDDNKRLEILQRVVGSSSGEFKEWETRTAQIFFYVKRPMPEAFCFQPFEVSLVSTMASRKAELWVRDATNRVAQSVSNTFGVRMDAQQTMGFSVDHALFVHRQHGATFEQCGEIQSRVYKRLAEEIQRGATALKDLHSLAATTKSERDDLDRDVQRWKESLEELEEQRRLMVYSADDPRVLVLEEQINVLRVEIAQAADVLEVQDTVVHKSQLHEGLLREYTKSCQGAMSAFIKLTKISKAKFSLDQEARGAQLLRLKSLMQRMDAQVGVMVGSYAQKSMQLLGRCSRSIDAMLDKIQPLVNSLALYSYENEDFGQVYRFVALPLIEQAVDEFVRLQDSSFVEYSRIIRQTVPTLELRKQGALNAIDEAKRHYEFTQNYYKEDIAVLDTATSEQERNDYLHMKDLQVEHIKEDKERIEVGFKRLQRCNSIFGKQLDTIEEKYWKVSTALHVSKVGQRLHDAFKLQRRIQKAIDSKDMGQVGSLTEAIFNDLENDEGYPSFNVNMDELFDILDKADDLLDEVEELEKAERRLRTKETQLMELEDDRLSRLIRLEEQPYEQDGSLFKHKLQQERLGVVKLFKDIVKGKPIKGQPLSWLKRNGKRQREIELRAAMLLQRVSTT